jgi:hypothetical protein
LTGETTWSYNTIIASKICTAKNLHTILCIVLKKISFKFKELKITFINGERTLTAAVSCKISLDFQLIFNGASNFKGKIIDVKKFEILLIEPYH